MAKNNNDKKDNKKKMPWKDTYGSDDLATAQKEYFKDVLGASSQYGNKLYAQGLPGESKYTQAYYAGVPSLYKYGDKEQAQALGRSGDLYGDYRRAGEYDKTKFKDFESKYGKAGKYDAMELEDLRRDYRETGQYDPSEFSRSDYRTQNIQERMSPYEQLVADRQRARLKRTYDEARGERELQAARAGAFGGSGAAIQEELARRNYAEQLADLDAQSLQSGYEAAVQLYGKEVADRMAAETAEEQSRQFGKGVEFQGLEGVLSARQLEEQSRQFGKQAEFQGIEGAMAARQQTAAQIAAAKEAELAGLAGQSESARLQAALAEQKKNMQLTNLAAMQQAGAQKEAYKLARQEYPLRVAAQQAAIAAQPASMAQAQMLKDKNSGTSTWGNILGGAATLGGVAQGLGAMGFSPFGRDGGLIPRDLRRYAGGGLADLQPQYYSKYER